MQVYHADPSSRLLLCAPQNFSADLLASALATAGVPHCDVLRLNDPRRPANTVRTQPTLPPVGGEFVVCV